MLAPALNKHFVQEQEVLTTAYAKAIPITQFTTALEVPITPTKRITKKPHNLLSKGYHFQDSEHIVFNALDLFYTQADITKTISLGGDIGYFSIEKKDRAKYNGTRYGVSLLAHHFTIRLGINIMEDFKEFVPTLTYENSYKKHNYSLEYTHQNALFYTFSLTPYEKRIDVDHFSVSDYLALANNTDLWANIELNHFSNNDTEFTLQYDWRLYYNTLHTQNFSYYIALEGWYTSHTKEHKDFYAPHFSDATLLRIDPHYSFSKYFGIKGRGGLGYSFKDKANAYKFGLWFFGNVQSSLTYSAGCVYSNATRVSASNSYSYDECTINLEYIW